MTAGDYYLCAPPAFIFPSGQQQDPANSPQATYKTPQPQAPDPDTDHLLQQLSPTQLAQPQPAPRLMRLSSRSTQHLTFKPLGPVGHHVIPTTILDSLLPQHNSDVIPNDNIIPFTPPDLFPYDPALHQLVCSLSPTHIQLIQPTSDLQPLYHASAFIIPKVSSNKLSLILHLRNWNKAQLYKPPAFKLPSCYTLRTKLLVAALKGVRLSFTTWDVKNFYWSLHACAMRFATTGPDGQTLIWQLRAIPFGWDKACFLGQTVHQTVVNKVPKPLNTTSELYIDDGLAMGEPQAVVTEYTAKVTQQLQAEGFIISDKSNLIANHSQEYIGKTYSSDGIANTTMRMIKLTALLLTASQAPFLTHKYVERLLGVTAYAVSHTSSFAALSYLRSIHQMECLHTGTGFKLTASLTTALAVALVPWRMQGFFPIRVPDSPLIYVDAGPLHIGLVFKLNNQWFQVSEPLPNYILQQSPVYRQQAAELYGVLVAMRLAYKYDIQQPTIVLDSTSAFGTCLKGSTNLAWARQKTLQRIQYLLQRKKSRFYIALINTRYHPADIPSRAPSMTPKPCDQQVQAKLDYIATHPALISSTDNAYFPDISSDAWATPEHIRKLLLKSPAPPTWDLFADQFNALAIHYCSLQEPFTPAVLTEEFIFFYQPPYQLLNQTWSLCLPKLSHTAGFWGLVPTVFYEQHIEPSLPSGHICAMTLHLDYQHPTLPQPGATFLSTLFFINPSPQECMCSLFSEL